MKPHRIVLLGAALVAGAFAACAALVFNPAIQTWTARRLFASRPGLHGSIGGLSVGLTEVDVTDLRLDPAGGSMALPSLRAEFPVLYAGLGKRLLIRRLVATGWTLDLSRAHWLSGQAADFPPSGGTRRRNPPPPLVPAAYADETAAVAALQVFEGLFHRLRLPVDLQLDGLDIEGDVILPPAPGYASARMHVVLSGGGLAAGREGQFIFNLRTPATAADPAIGSVTAEGTVAAEMDTPRTFRRLVVRIDAAAAGGRFPPGAKLAVDMKAERSARSESYLFALAGKDKNLVAVQTDYSGDTHRLAGTWKLDASDDDLAPFALGRPLPAFAAAGEGSFDTDAAMNRLHVSGRIDATVDRLGAVRPELAAMGAVKLAAEFDLSHLGGKLRVDRLSVELAGVRPIAQVHALQPFAFDVRTGALEVADPAHDLVGIALEDLPVDWAQPFLSGVVLTGGGLRGDFVASARAGGLALRAPTPLTVAGLSVTRSGQPLLSGVDVAVSLSADYTPLGWEVQVSPCAVQRGGATLFTLEATAGRLAGANQPTKAAGRLKASLPALLSGSPAGGIPAFTRGEFDGQFSVILGETSAYQANIKLSGLAVGGPSNPEASPGGEAVEEAGAPQLLPTITADMRADLDARGKWTVLAPFTFEGSDRKSDLTVAGTVDPREAGIEFDGNLTSRELSFDDARVFGALLAAAARPPDRASEPVSGGMDSPAEAFWSRLTGRMTFALAKVRRDSLEWDNVSGVLLIRPAAFSIENLHAGLGVGGELSGGGTLDFTAGAAEPYAWKADLAATDFDFGAFSRLLHPDQPPVVEGRFKISGQLRGAGANVDDLADGTQGEFQLASKGGIFRALRADVADSLKQSPALISQVLDSVGSLFGIKEDKTADAKQLIDKQGKIVVALADRLAEIPYDQVNLVARRGSDLNVNLTEFALISPEVRLSGNGRVAYQKGVPFAEEPFAFDGQLDARGRMADLLGSLGLLSAQQDDLGYARMARPFHLGGTLDAIDAGQWRDALVKAALHKAAGGLLDKLLGK
jgi:hypothetical protein